MSSHLPHSGAGGYGVPSPGARAGEMADAAARHDGFRHLALFYRGSGEYLPALCGFIQSSRARGGPVLVAVPQRKAQLVRRELGDDSAQVTLIDMTELGRNPARIIPAFLA